MSTSHSAHNHLSVPHQRLVVERRWRLGLGSRGHPSAVMQELYACLRRHGVSWKKPSPYTLKCRCVLQLSPGRQAGAAAGDAVVDGGGNGGTSAQLPRALPGVMAGADELPLDQRLVKFEVQLYKVRAFGRGRTGHSGRRLSGMLLLEPVPALSCSC